MTNRAILGIACGALMLAACATESESTKSQAQLAEAQKQDAELEQEYQDLNKALGADLSAKTMQITRLQEAIKLSINNELLFPSGGWEMSDSAKDRIAQIAKVLAPHQTTKIDVNGHTDNVPIGPALASQGVTSNLILSEKRANTVLQFMISQGVRPDLVSARGFGDSNPVASNDTAEGRAQNRRVELTASVKK